MGGVETTAIRASVDHALDEFHAATSTLTKQIERVCGDIATSDERSRAATRLAEEASVAAESAAARVAGFEARVEDSAETRCQRAERVAREAGQEAMSHADVLVKQISHVVEDLKGTVSSISKQVRCAVDDARGSDERGVATTKAAQ